MSKNVDKRHAAIMEIVRNQQIRGQHQLIRALSAYGIECTQSTISRDKRELGLVKTKSGFYALESDRTLYKTMDDVLESCERAGNMVVFRVAPGMAMSMAVALDRAQLPQVVGTVAGDDTVMIACKSEDDAEFLVESASPFC